MVYSGGRILKKTLKSIDLVDGLELVFAMVAQLTDCGSMLENSQNLIRKNLL